MDTQAPFASFGEFLRAVIVASERGGKVHDSLKQQAAPSGLYEGGGSAGGFLVPEDVAQRIWTRAYSMGRIIDRCERQPVTRAGGVVLPLVDETSRINGSRFGGIQMGWVDEAGFVAASKPKLAALKMQLKKLLGMAYVTDELLQDAPALSAALERLFSMEAAFVIEDAIINGTGAGMPLGVLNSAAKIVVAKEVGQATNTILYQNLAKMVARLWSGSFPTAIWLMSSEVYGVVLQMSDGAGDPIIQVDAGIARILTIPVMVCEYTPALGSEGDITLCDFSQYLLAETSPGIDSSIHVQFVQDETAFRFRFRTDGGPGWKSPTVPKNGSTTVSPIIALAARP